MSWREDCFKADCEGACGDICMMYTKPKPNLCPYCKEDFQGKGYLYMAEHNCPEWQESLRTKPVTWKEIKGWFRENYPNK